MLLESVGSAAKSAEELLNNIIEKKISIEGSFRVEDHFTGLLAFSDCSTLCFISFPYL